MFAKPFKDGYNIFSNPEGRRRRHPLETRRITRKLETEALADGGRNGQRLSAGDTLANRYLIQEVIGVGGMSAVYRARDLHFPNIVKLVAIKEMRTDATDPNVRATMFRNFEREAHIIASLNHPAIPHIYDYFTHNDRAYLVLEYVNGQNLEEILQKTEGFLPEEQVLAWAIELCDVLHYLHTRQPAPVIFRDMKPSNIMITQSGKIMVVDFGIAKIFQAGQKGTMIGTEGYAPPEQYRGEATPQVDIYALGATLHHLLTRRDPRTEPPFSFHERPIRQINPSVSPELEAIVQRALEYDAARRFQSALEMKEALLAVARKTGALSLLGPASKQTLHGLTAGLAGGQGVKPLWVFEAEDEVRGTPLLHEGRLYVGSYDTNLYALDAGDGTMIWKYPSRDGVVTRPVADKTHVYFGSRDGTFYALGHRHGRPIWQYEVGAPIYSSPRMAEGYLFFGADDGRLHVVQATSGRRVWAFEAGAAVRCTPFAGENRVYFGTEEGDFYALDFSGKMQWRYRAKRGILSSPIVADKTVYFADLGGVLHALDAESGWVLWRFRMGKGSVSSPAVSGRYVVLGSADGAVYCVDAERGREVWRFQTEHQVPGSPLIHQETVYIGSADGYMYALTLAKGRLLWKFPTDGPITGSAVVHNAVLYFGSADHRVYAVVID